MFKVGGNVARYSITGPAKRKTNIHNSEELIQKIWESVRSNNGIMVCVCVCNCGLNNHLWKDFYILMIFYLNEFYHRCYCN